MGAKEIGMLVAGAFGVGLTAGGIGGFCIAKSQFKKALEAKTVVDAEVVEEAEDEEE